MIPIVEDIVRRFDLEDFVVVADSGLMNKTNIALLESGGYKYIIGAGIKNETEEIRQWILSVEKYDGCFYELGKLPHSRLIVGYSERRAKKDRYNREKGVKRLQKAYKSGQITKGNINKRGYNKFLEIPDNVKVSITQDKINEDGQWDGLKGYLTNTELPTKEVYGQYSGLWQVERAFRMTGGTLELRPMFHFTPKRIEAHVCICFVAYRVYKELERILQTSPQERRVAKGRYQNLRGLSSLFRDDERGNFLTSGNLRQGYGGTVALVCHVSPGLSNADKTGRVLPCA